MKGAALVLALLGAAGGQDPGASVNPSAGIGIDQRLNEPVPLGAVFRDEAGRVVRLGDCLAGRPAVLVLVYYRCPMLCNEVLDGLLRSLRTLALTAGREFTVVAVSIDPRETPDLAAAKRDGYLHRYARPAAGSDWRFLTGEEGSIRTLARAVGFRYRYDERTGLFAHAGGAIVLTPDGRIARYFYGIEFPPRDLRLGLVEAAAGKIATAADRVLLLCLRYDPATGKYSLALWNAVRLGAALTAALLAGFIVVMLRRERRRAGKGAPPRPALERARTV
jgi:protein SCO1/2